MNTNKDECGLRKLKSAPANSLGSLSVLEMKERLKGKGVKGLWQMKRDELCATLLKRSRALLRKKATPSQSKPKNTMQHLQYDNNSCYIDTTISSLFTVTKEWLTKNIFNNKPNHEKHPKLQEIAAQIKKELLRISQGGQNACSTLRSMFKKFDKIYAREYNVELETFNWLDEQQEPRDVLNMLLRVFEIKPDVKVGINGRKDLLFFNSVIVPSGDLYRAKDKINITLADYFSIYKDATTTTYKDANILCINVDRNYKNQKVKTPFTFKKTIQSTNGTQLALTAIIIHRGHSASSGHYTCFLKANASNSWHHHDDMNEHEERIGTFQDLLEYDDGIVTKNCVLLVYSSK